MRTLRPALSAEGDHAEGRRRPGRRQDEDGFRPRRLIGGLHGLRRVRELLSHPRLKVRGAALVCACAALLSCTLLAEAVDPAAFIDAALARGEKTIRVPKGVYEVAPGEVASVYPKGVQGVTVDFQGSELRGRTRSALVTLRDCTGVTVKNATLDYPFNLPFTQGFVEAVGPDGEWDVRIAQGIPTRRTAGGAGRCRPTTRRRVTS